VLGDTVIVHPHGHP